MSLSVDRDRFKEHPRLLPPQGATYIRRYSLEHRGGLRSDKKKTVRKRAQSPLDTVRSRSKRSRMKVGGNRNTKKPTQVNSKVKVTKSSAQGKSPLRGQRGYAKTRRSRLRAGKKVK